MVFAKAFKLTQKVLNPCEFSINTSKIKTKIFPQNLIKSWVVTRPVLPWPLPPPTLAVVAAPGLPNHKADGEGVALLCCCGAEWRRQLARRRRSWRGGREEKHPAAAATSC
jgi:hypothetical protein